MINLEDRIAGGIWGLLVGDAVGVPYEFNLPADLPAYSEIDVHPPAGFQRSHAGVPVGTWSDDGAHALCLLASLLHCGKLDLEDLMRRLTNWYDHGYMTPDGKVFDVGIQTSTALQEFKSGTAAKHCGPDRTDTNGNGSLMRVLPLALWHQGSDESLIADAKLQSVVTHGHLRAQLCCALYCLWARRILQEKEDPWTDAVATLRSTIFDGSEEQAELEFHIRPDDEPGGDGSGYVVDCLRSARRCVEQDDYEDVVRTAIKLGRDTDTTACVAGGIAGIQDGKAAVPDRWLDALQGKEIVTPLLQKLLDRSA